MTTTVLHDLPSPFTAVVQFRPGSLYQQKYEKWIFKSNMLTMPNANAGQHYRAVENIVLNDLKCSFICASIFDNRLAARIPKNLTDESPKPLILQVYGDNIYIDNRQKLNLSFLYPTFDRAYLERLSLLMEIEKNEIDFDANRLRSALQDYKLNLNL